MILFGKAAKPVYNQLAIWVAQPEKKDNIIMSTCLTELSVYCFLKSQYNLALKWAMKGVESLTRFQMAEVILMLKETKKIRL